MLNYLFCIATRSFLDFFRISKFSNTILLISSIATCKFIFLEGKHALLILNIDQHLLIGLRYIDTRYLWEYEIQNVIDIHVKIKHQEEKHTLLILNIDQHLLIGLRCIDTRYLWKYEMHNVIDTH